KGDQRRLLLGTHSERPASRPTGNCFDEIASPHWLPRALGPRLLASDYSMDLRPPECGATVVSLGNTTHHQMSALGQKQTLVKARLMSALCQKQTLLNYSSTSSARESTLFGIAKFIALAVFMLTTNR